MPNAHECARLLLQTIPYLMRGIKEAIRPPKAGDDEALSMGQLRMLDMLGHAPCTLGELASRHHVTPSTMSRTVDLLVRRQWVARRNDSRDRRQVILTLTEEGQAARAAMGQHAEQATATIMAQLSDDERARLYDGLSILRRLMDRSAPDACEPPPR